MHNNIMAAGSRDRPSMLATGRYVGIKSLLDAVRITTAQVYVNTALMKLYKDCLKLMLLVKVTTAQENILSIPELSVPKTFLNISPKNKAHYDTKVEAINLALTVIGDDIYSIIDASKTTHDMWIAIERLQQGESLNKQDVKTSLFQEFGRFTSRDGQSIESYYSRFHKIMNEMVRNQLEVATMNVNPLALVAAAQQYPNTYYKISRPNKTYAPPSEQSSSTRSHASTRYKDKEIAKPIIPPSVSASEEDSDPEQAQKDKDM
uniref:Gag-Pol polyprotein n=1 Tax=Tanacetum cinerariifolium TaxID=118510 RepID=A0A6L2MNL0_TANCI|nr:hypothetical protein [Tanacetum cinerariifolium]